MRMERSEAFDMFRKWNAEKPLLLCVYSFAAFQACFKGRIFETSDDIVRIVSDDHHSELALKITQEMHFGYGDSRKHPEEAALYDASILVYFSAVIPDVEPDFIAFTEVKSL
ncbi:MAG: hypothetical protein JWM08_128 [Candidatus Angelobacter sp.]|nr:hypothetical protein [Candidatus Angelobacter sp.]